jgi:hypothetical protein
MPKGYKSEHGYATVASNEGCMGYREIAEVMTGAGDKMNHSTARNIFLRAMEKIAGEVCTSFDGQDSRRVSQDPRFQSAIYEIIASM